MKYRVRVGDTDHEVDVTPEGEGRFQVSIGGRSFQVVLSQSGPEESPLYTLELEGASVNFHAQGAPSALEVLLGSELFRTEVSRGGAGSGSQAAGAEGPLQIRAAMPGVVKEIYVAEGEPVTRGSRLLVLEAMKMNNEIRSPRDGVIEAVRASAGQRVEKDAVLLVIR